MRKSCLINPNGTVFGPNASLNVGGSFVASTANALQFGNLGFFSATDKNIPSPLLTINPSALLFNQINQNAAIQNNSVAPAGIDPAGLNAFGLRVPDGKSLLLVGGNVSMDRGRLNANGGRVELGGLTQPGTLLLGVDGDNLSLIFSDNVARSEVSLTNSSGVFVTGAGGGNIAVYARNLEILEGSILSAGIGQPLGTLFTVAGDIRLNATGEIKVAGGSIVRNLVRLGSQGNGGNISIDSGSLSLQDGAQLTASTLGQGDTGNVNLNVTGAIDIAGRRQTSPSGIFSRVGTGTVGNGGNITIDSGSFSLRDGAQINASIRGRGNAGNVTVSATDFVSLADANIFSAVEAGGVGKGGNININAATLSLTDGAQLLTLTRSASSTQPARQGDTGNVNLNVTGAIDIAGSRDTSRSGIFSRVETGTVGNGGNITIDSGSFSLRDGAQLNASIRGRGNAGNVTVSATDFVSLADANIFSAVEAGGVGKGSNININAATLSLIDGAQLVTSIRRASDTLPAGQGDAGNVNVKVTRAVDIAGEKNGLASGILSSVGEGTVGRGGSINLSTDLLAVINGAQINVSTRGQGDAGNIDINVRDRVSFYGTSGDSSFSSGAFSSVGEGAVGKGGSVNLSSGSLYLTNGAQVSASTRGLGDAGILNVTVGDYLVLSGTSANGQFASGLTSAVEQGAVGNGGNITLLTNGRLMVLDGAEATVSNLGRGDAGNLKVTADSINLNNQGRLTAESVTGRGGDIRLQATDLFVLRRNSLISAISGVPGNDGRDGNINVETKYLIAVPSENSDIVATGFGRSPGSNIQVNAQGIFSRPKSSAIAKK
ncbi:MAG: hypothetical protein KME38_30245 [Spirirestis rafaelensis WJT71-NPBG6]|jgi:large exoprotein involved in heme utilization and adhesion|nr:hypothetical protein [Spirirestis rafaelensis WJT71-NPBG6]